MRAKSDLKSFGKRWAFMLAGAATAGAMLSVDADARLLEPMTYDEVIVAANAGEEVAEPSVERSREWFGVADSKPMWQWDRVTGDWGGLRTGLEDAGISFGAEYIWEWSSVWSGGINQSASDRNLFTADLAFDLEKLIGLQGGMVFAQYLSVNAETGGSLDAGDIQVYSNIENDRSLDVLYELWYEQVLFNDRLRLKFGKVDANLEFNYVDAAGDFANSSAGSSPTIFAFPTYPDPATSINLFLTVIDSDNADLALSYGFYDGAAAVDGIRIGTRGPSTFFSDDLSDDYFHIAEAALTWETLGPVHDGRASLGGWWHSGDFERFEGGLDDGTGGFYLTVEQRLLARDAKADDTGLYVFAQYGWADEAVSEFAHHIAGGIVLRGMLPGRISDSAGVYVSYVDLSDEPGAGFAEDETVIDVYYRVQLTPAVFVQPELQYILNPSGDPSVDDAVVGGLRVGIAF